MKSRLIIAALTAVLVAPSAAHAAKPARVFVRTATDLATLQADETTCSNYAKGVPTPGMPPMVTTGGVAGAAGAALATGFLAGLEEAKARRVGFERCMKARGYAKVTLSQTEETGLRAAKPQAARDVWFTTFLADPNLAARIETARTQTQDLPPIPEAATSTDGLVLDLAQAKPAEGMVVEDGALLVIPATHVATARLVSDYPVSNMLGINKRGVTGAVFHAVARGPYVAQWCGPFLNNSVRGEITMTSCVDAQGDGFKVIEADGAPWLAGGVMQGGFPVDDPPKLEVSPNDLIGPVILTITLDKITKKGVRLKAVATRDGEAQTVTVWRGGGNFDAEGRLAVPLWGHRLVLVRQDQGVVGAFSADGDGRGWYATGTP